MIENRMIKNFIYCFNFCVNVQYALFQKYKYNNFVGNKGIRVKYLFLKTLNLVTKKNAVNRLFTAVFNI